LRDLGGPLPPPLKVRKVFNRFGLGPDFDW